MIKREQIEEILKNIKHPTLGNDLVTLKMVAGIGIEGNKVSISLVSPGKKDPFSSSLKKVVEKAVKSIDSNLDVKINMKIAGEPDELPVLPGVKNTLAIASGKGGVGKSTVAVNLAVALAKQGYRTGLIDADIFGPSIPKMMDAEEFKPYAVERNGHKMIVPAEKYGVKFLSIGLFVSSDNAVVWRGPMASRALGQMLTEVDWGELDFMLFDLPPGTSDIHLTLVQQVSLTGALIVSTPQEIALADAIRGISMFNDKNVNVPVLGLVENMAWFTPLELPENRYYIFGKNGCDKVARQFNIPVLAEIPIVQGIREGGDKGEPVALSELPTTEAFNELAINVIKQVEMHNKSKIHTGYKSAK